MHYSSWDCAEIDLITDFRDCPQKIDNEACTNYTFTWSDFGYEQEKPKKKTNSTSNETSNSNETATPNLDPVDNPEAFVLLETVRNKTTNHLSAQLRLKEGEACWM